MENTLSPLVAYKRSRSLDSSNWYMGSLLTFLAESKDTGGSFTLIEGLLKPGNEPPPHMHGREDELFYILEGEMDMYVGNEVFKAGAGECLFLPSVPSRKYWRRRCVQNGPSARREEGAYLNRYVTDEQRGRRPIFNATLRDGASWLFFRVARSTRMTQIWALRSRLEKQPTDRRRRHHYLRDGTLGSSRTLSSSGLLGSALLSCSCPVDSMSAFAPGVRAPRDSRCHLRLLPIQLPISDEVAEQMPLYFLAIDEANSLTSISE
jgi:hypothetical protein